jgi:integrase
MKHVKLNLSGLRNFQRAVAADLAAGGSGPMRDALHQAAARLRAFWQQKFLENSRGGGGWPALKPSTIRGRRSGARTQYRGAKKSLVKARENLAKAEAGYKHIVYGHTRRCLVEYFGADKRLSAISPGDADDWRRWLASDQALAENTIRRRCGIAKQFLRVAVKKRLLAENPFAEIGTTLIQANRTRDYFLSQADAKRVLDACPDAQWRLLFSLSRYGGMRCPSEHLALTWADVHWDRNRITVHASKTEHHADGGVRQFPIFPELRPYLEEVFNETETNLGRPPAGAEHVITRYRHANVNLRTQLLKIIARAGVAPWPKLFQNLRATRATELISQGWPEYKVCKWLGHTKAIAEKHYWQVTEEDFATAAGVPTEKAPVEAPKTTAARQCHAEKEAVSAECSVPTETREKQQLAAVGTNLRCMSHPLKVGDKGLEPPTSTV